MYHEQSLPRTVQLPQCKPRRRLRGEQGRDPYDGLRPWSAITHGLGILLAIAGTFFLMLRAVFLASTWHAAAYFVYGATMFALYTASTLYHCLNVSVKGRMLLRKLDHTSIYLLIAGTYTPICLTALRGPWGWGLFGIIWALAAAGIVLAFAWIMAPRWLTAGIYLFMGWLALTAILALIWVVSAAATGSSLP